MALFNSSDIKPRIESPENQFTAARTRGTNRFSLGVRGSRLDDIIGTIVPDENIHIPARASWSSHHLIEYLIGQIGPAAVWLTSWSVKEQAIRNLLGLIDAGKITQLTCLFDERIRVQCPDAHQLASRAVSNLKLMKIHAKCIVLLNDQWGISISTSANLTRNPRVEKYVICTDPHIAQADREWIERELANANPFEL